MCFSATASFAAGTVLVPAGIYCLTSAWRKQRSSLPLAAVPLCFGIQQISEGFVWHGLTHNEPEMARSAAYVFLFFALAFWPFWFPFISAVSDTRPQARRWFTGMAIAASAWFWVLFYPVVTGPISNLSIEIVHHSIRYDISNLPVNQEVPRPLLRMLYFLCVAVPLATGSGKRSRWPGILFAGSAILAAIIFEHAFVSVWCFFAAWLSGYLCWYFWVMEPDETRRAEPATC